MTKTLLERQLEIEESKLNTIRTRGQVLCPVKLTKSLMGINSLNYVLLNHQTLGKAHHRSFNLSERGLGNLIQDQAQRPLVLSYSSLFLSTLE